MSLNYFSVVIIIIQRKAYEHSCRKLILKHQMFLFSVISLPNMNNTRKHMTEDLYYSQGMISTYTVLENYLFNFILHPKNVFGGSQ